MAERSLGWAPSIRSLPILSRLPSYASTDPAVRHSQPSGPANTADLPGTDQVLEIYKSSTGGLDVLSAATGQQRYWIGRWQIKDTPDITVHGGYDSNGPLLAQAEFQTRSKDFRFYVGTPKHTGSCDWETVSCAADDKIVRQSDAYEFYASGFMTGSEGERAARRKLCWKKTSNTRLGASRFSGRDFKLIDDERGTLLAVYTQQGLGRTGKLVGKIVFWKELGEQAELAALTAIVAVVEKMNRSLRSGPYAMNLDSRRNN